MKRPYFVRVIILAGSLLLQLSTLCFQSRGAAGDVDLSFDPGSGVNGPVRAIALQPDGKVIIGGEFTMVKGLARIGVARLNADGSGDGSFNAWTGPDAWGHVYAAALQADGKVLVGHDTGISRLNSDGSQDTNFIAGIGFICGEEGCFRSVSRIAVQSDGKVLIAGYFSTGIGTNYNYGFARLNANGSLDNGFNPGAGAGQEFVYSIALQPDGKVLIGGGFTTVNGTNHRGIARLNTDGSLDISFNPGTGADLLVRSVVVQSNGKVLIGGYFTTVNGTNRTGIARLHADGSLDGSFKPALTNFGYADVRAMVVQPDGKVLIGGGFATVNGTNRNNLARLNSDGSLDSSFDAGTGADLIYPAALQPDGKLLIGGYFSTVNGTNRTGIARLNADGSLDGNFNPGTGVNNSVAALVVQPDGRVLIAGNFTTVKDLERSGMARLNANGSGDGSFNAASTVFAYGDVYAMALQPDGKVLRGAIITRLNANGSQDNSFNPDLTAIYSTNCPAGYDCSESAVANAVVVQPDGKLLLGGYTANYQCDQNEGGCLVFYRYLVIRFNPDGSRDTSFEPAVGNVILNGGERVQALALQADGKIVVAGAFDSINGTNRNAIARLNANGTLDSSFNVGTGANGNVRTIALQADGKVLVGGSFFILNGTYIYGITRLNADGSLDGTFNPGTGVGISGQVRSVASQSDGKVLIGGYFTAFNGTNRNRIARLNADGTLDSSFNPGTGADGVVHSIALQPDGKVLIGGDFATVNGAARARVARLYGDSAAPSLNIARSNAFMIVSWPVMGLNFQLQETTDFSLPNSWSAVSQPAVTNAGQVSVTVPATVGRKFFRLKSQ